ncbi:MAG: hypothetical protein ACK47B_24920 [Armatimonadota bacterium]
MRSTFLLLTLSLLLVRLLPAAGAGQSSDTAPERARSIRRDLESRRLTEALGAAERAVRAFPEDPQLRLRYAQAQLCRALVTHTRLQAALRDSMLERWLGLGFHMVSQFTPEQREMMRLNPDKLQGIIDHSRNEQVEAFRRAAREGGDRCRPWIGEVGQALHAALASLKDARSQSAAGAELELTELWAYFLPLLWKDELRQTTELVKSWEPESELAKELEQLGKGFEKLGELTPDTLLARCSEVVERRAADPVALAGVADLTGLLCQAAEKPDPIGSYSSDALHVRVPRPGEEPRLRPRQTPSPVVKGLFEEARRLKEPDLKKTPATAGWQLYLRAYELGKAKKSVPRNLPLRLYFPRAAFDSDGAAALLEEAERLDRRNAAIPLERARMHLVEDRPAEALSELRAAVLLPRLSRSCLVAAPSPLRPFLSLDVRLRELTERAWPGYEDLFDFLRHLQAGQQEPATALELCLLRLRLSERLCGASDAADLACGIDQRASALRELIGAEGILSDPQRAQFTAQLQAHQRAFGEFPRKRTRVVVSATGLGFDETPRLYSEYPGAGGVQLQISPVSASIAPDVQYRPQRR